MKLHYINLAFLACYLIVNFLAYYPKEINIGIDCSLNKIVFDKDSLNYHLDDNIANIQDFEIAWKKLQNRNNVMTLADIDSVRSQICSFGGIHNNLVFNRVQYYILENNFNKKPFDSLRKHLYAPNSMTWIRFTVLSVFLLLSQIIVRFFFSDKSSSSYYIFTGLLLIVSLMSYWFFKNTNFFDVLPVYVLLFSSASLVFLATVRDKIVPEFLQNRQGPLLNTNPTVPSRNIQNVTQFQFNKFVEKNKLDIEDSLEYLSEFSTDGKKILGLYKNNKRNFLAGIISTEDFKLTESKIIHSAWEIAERLRR